MDDRQRRVKELFIDARDRQAKERNAFLAEACAGDTELRLEVESLLLDHDRTDDGAAIAEAHVVNARAGAVGATLGRYRIHGLLGEGGMGAVYEAEDPALRRRVALKVLPDAVACDKGRLERFKREAQSLAALSHPNVVTIYSVEKEAGSDRGSDRHFLTMELVPGEPLSRRIPNGGLDAGTILDLTAQLADGLRAAHERGIVHRDLKPANLMVDTGGRLRILDFGLAKATLEAADGSQAPIELTAEGTTLGTAPYMSPEQAAGKGCDARSDIFSVGTILYEMATGRRAFLGSSFGQVMSAVLQEDPPVITERRPDLPPGLLRLIDHCLEKDPARRFQTAAELRAAVEALRQGRRFSDDIGRPKATGWLALVAAAVVALAIVAFWVGRGENSEVTPSSNVAASPNIQSIAVLPLDNLSGDPDQDYFAEGITEELTTDLAMIGQLKVISRGSVMHMKGAERPPTPEIAKLLGVDAIVEGSVRRSDDRVRITAQLIDAREEVYLWADSFERESRDVLALQAEVASAIAREIHVQLTPATQSRLEQRREVDRDAYDAYLKGRYFFNRPSDENLRRAISRFEEAIEIDPTFVPALSGLSDAYLWAGYNEGFLTATEARGRAKEAAEQAVRLDDASAEAHTSLAVFKAFYEYDWAGAEAEFRRAMELNPSYAYAPDQYSYGLSCQGRFEEAIAENARAEELDPLSPQIPLDALGAYVWSGDDEGALRRVARSVELDPTYFFSAWAHGWVDIQAGRVSAAIPHFEKAKEMGAPAFVIAWLAYASGAAGDREAAQAELEELEAMSPDGSPSAFNLALVSLGLAESGRAMSYLEQAYASDSQWLGSLKYDRAFDALRFDPRFDALLRKLNLKE